MLLAGLQRRTRFNWGSVPHIRFNWVVSSCFSCKITLFQKPLPFIFYRRSSPASQFVGLPPRAQLAVFQAARAALAGWHARQQPAGLRSSGRRKWSHPLVFAVGVASVRCVLSNPSLKWSANGRPPGPGRRYPVHFRQPGPGVPPSSPT